MQIGKPQITTPKLIEEQKLEQASSELQAGSPGFAKEDLLDVAPNNDGHAPTISAESFAQPKVPHPSLHGPHFELGGELREAYATPDNPVMDAVTDEGISDFFGNQSDPVPIRRPSIKAELENVARIVDNLKDAIQDSVESTIHPFEDWFD